MKALRHIIPLGKAHPDAVIQVYDAKMNRLKELEETVKVVPLFMLYAGILQQSHDSYLESLNGPANFQ